LQKANIDVYVDDYAKDRVSQNTATGQYNSITPSALGSLGTDPWVSVLLHYRIKNELHFNDVKIPKLSGNDSENSTWQCMIFL
jgi:hypothetical protein